MSRTTSNTVEYFPHFCKTGGKTIFILKSRFGNDGYAFWFQLLEVLCQSEGHYYDCRSPELWQYLVSFCDSKEITATEILNLLATLGNIDAELWQARVIWCQALVNNLKEVYRKRGRDIPQKPTLAEIHLHNISLLYNKTFSVVDNNDISGDKKGITGADKPISVAEMPQSIVEHSRVEKSREETTPLPPSQDNESLSLSIDEDDVLEIANQEKIPVMPGEIEAACKKYTPEWVRDAIKQAVLHEQRKWSYVAGVLEKCLDEGHSPDQPRARPAPPGKTGGQDAPGKYFRGPYGHLVQH
jgi:hypothetical protein